MLFQIEYIFANERPVTLLARQLETGDFTLPISPRLAGVPLQRQLSQPRALKPDGTPDLELFMFTLTDARNRQRLSVGLVAELE